jgi:hypothetical protein
MAHCNACHTPLTPKFGPIPGMEMAGGNPVGKEVVSANLTPVASGICSYDEVLSEPSVRIGFVRTRQLNSAMPWRAFGNMADNDLKAVSA